MFVALFKTFSVCLRSLGSGLVKPHAAHLLESVAQHGAVDLIADIWTYLNHEIWSDPEQILVIGGVVYLA